MKNYRKLFAALFGTLLLLGACADLLKPPDSSVLIPADKGRLVINITDPARTALPSGNFTKYVLRFTGPGSFSHEDMEWSSGLSVDLEPGSWTVYVDAYGGTAVSGTGSAAVTVNAGMTTPVNLEIGMYTGGTAQGTLKYTISYPPPGADHSYTAQTLTVKTPDGNIVGEPTYPVINGSPRDVSLNAGVYIVTVQIINMEQRTTALRTDVVHIYAGRETQLSYTIAEAEFVAAVPLTWTVGITVPGSITVTNRVVRAYSDSACTELLGTSASPAVSGDQNFTFFIPVRNAAVYLRQEIQANGVSAWGISQYKSIPLNQDAPLSGSYSDTFYAITTGPYTGGTVTAVPPAAVSGTTVTLTVTPDAGYELQSGTLGVTRDSNSVGILLSGSGPYTFTMPASPPDANVTVGAQFISAPNIRYVAPTASGNGNGSSWANASDDLQAMIDEVHSSSDPDEKIIRVAAGTYKPKYKPNSSGDSTSAPGDRDSTFILRQGVQIRGGYVAGVYIDEETRQARFNTDGTVKNAAQHETILSGDIGTAASSDNTYHVVLAVDISETNPAVLDGFTITGGYANGTGSLTVSTRTIQQVNGGGVFNSYSLPELKNVTIKNNHASGTGATGTGGGMYNINSSPKVTAVTIFDNTASKAGGGMYNNSSSPILTDVTISNNTANDTNGSDGMGGGIFNGNGSNPTLLRVRIIGNTASNASTAPQGGGMHNSSSSAPVLINVLIAGNRAVRTSGTDNGSGGGIYVAGPSPLKLTNVTIAGNYAVNGGAITNNANMGTSLTITNSVIWGNEGNFPGIAGSGGTLDISYSLVQGNNSTSNGNLDGNDPLFISSVPATFTDATTGGNYRLDDGSPVIDKGNDGKYTTARGIPNFTEEKDLGGENRKKGGSIDMGAYEYQE